MDVRKYWLAIDTTALLIQKVQKASKSQKIAETLFIDIKRVFDHIFWAQLAQKMFDLSIDDNSIR